MQKVQMLIADPVLTELLAWAKPQDFTRESTTFDLGYEQAKRELLRKLEVILGTEFEPQDSYDFVEKHKRRIGVSALARQTGRL